MLGGAVVVGDGAVVVGDGAVVVGDGAVVVGDGVGDGAVVVGDGAVVEPGPGDGDGPGLGPGDGPGDGGWPRARASSSTRRTVRCSVVMAGWHGRIRKNVLVQLPPCNASLDFLETSTVLQVGNGPWRLLAAAQLDSETGNPG